MIRGLLFAVSAALVLAMPASATPSAPGAISWEPYDLKLRSGDHHPGEIGTLEVPLLRGRANSGTLRLRFVRLAATGKPDGPPIIYLAGGPGSSGIEAAQGDRSVLFDRLRKHGDVILLDQRGTGLSSPPPSCSTKWHFPDDVAATEENTNRSLGNALAVCAAEWRSAGVVLEAFNSADNAADVADLIKALGTGKARLVGISYGTFLGFAVLRDHGQLIDRVVLAGTEGPDHTMKLPTQADPVLQGLSERFSRRPDKFDLAGSVRRIFAQLAQAPVEAKLSDGKTQVVSLYDVQWVTGFMMATSENARWLPDLYQAMEKGDFGSMAANIRRLRGFYGALPGMPFAMDAASPVSPARIAEAERLAGKSLFDNGVNFPSLNLAKAMSLPQLPSRYYGPLKSNVPALFISGELDSRTPPANAEEVRRGFTTSAHLIIGGGGHDNDLFLATPLILDRIDSFLAGKPVKDETLAVDWPAESS
jgi:pimeloyl-ACP methyl ester carboxylesterase